MRVEIVSVGVCEIQLKVHNAVVLKSLLGIIWDEVPDPGIWDMDCAKEVRQRVSLYGPQEGIQFTLLKEKETTLRYGMKG